MYSEKVMDHFQHPRNVGEIENATAVGPQPADRNDKLLLFQIESV